VTRTEGAPDVTTPESTPTPESAPAQVGVTAAPAETSGQEG